MLNNDKYEASYREARDVLHRRGKKVGKPVQGVDGVRYCAVDALPLTDRALLTDAWGAALADEILNARHDAAPPLWCNHCDCLWQEYTTATGRYLKLLIESHKAGQRQPANLAQFDPIALQAATIRHYARQALRDHAAHHYPAQQCA